jgi:tyrosine-protein kinase Etk/Wzc
MEELHERQVSFNDYLRIFYRGRWVIITTFLLVMGLTVYITFTATPEYEAAAKLMIEDKGGMEQSLFDIGSLMKKETMVNNQVEILRSRTLAEIVIRRLQDSELAGRLSLLYPPDQQATGLVADFGRWMSDLVSFSSDTSDQYTIDDMIIELRDRLIITPIRDTDMIEIRVTGPTAEEAAFITNTLAQAYSEKNRLESQEEVRQVKNFLDEQLTIVKQQLTESEEALKNFKEGEKVVALSDETEELIKKMAEFESLYNEALTEYNSNRERLKYVNTQLDRSRQNFDLNSIAATPYIEGFKKQIGELQGKKASMISRLLGAGVYRDDDPQVRKYDEEIDAVTKQLKEEITKLAAVEILNPVALSEELSSRKIEIEANLQALQPKVEALKRIVSDYDKQLETLPDKSLRLARLQRAAQADEKIYLMMQEKFQESRITEVGQLGQVRLIDPARPPQEPVRPRKKLNLILGFIVGLGLGIGLTFLFEYMDNTVRAIEDIEKIGVTVLGSIPMIKEEEAVKRMKILPASMNGKNGSLDSPEARRMVSRLITHFAPKSPISEAYRTFRTNIQYTKLDHDLKALLVTSPGPGEGKSTSVANLAITMAQMGSKVLLIDSDLRRPILHSIFNIDRRVGLSNVLVGRATIEEAAQATEIDNLFVMPCGTLPPNPSELLGSSAMKTTLEAMKQKFDIVLFDSPPIIAVTDAAVLSSQLDGVILVIKSGQTDREAAFRAYTLLKNVKTRVLGALLNGVHIESMYGSYYYYYHYYYYGKDGDKKKKKTRSRKQGA